MGSELIEIMKNMAIQQQQLTEQLRIGQQQMRELQATVQQQSTTIQELRARERTPSPTPSMDRAFMEFMAQQNLQHTQALSKIAEAIEKMDDKGGTVDMKNVGKI